MEQVGIARWCYAQTKKKSNVSREFQELFALVIFFLVVVKNERVDKRICDYESICSSTQNN